MMNIKKRQAANEKNNALNRWIISYADLLTLLFAFFVVMYALSSIDEVKYKAFVDSTNKEFHISASQTESMHASIQTPPIFTPENYIELLSKDISKFTDQDKDENESAWMEIRLNSKTIFDSSSAEPRGSVIPLIDKLIQDVKNKSVFITVEGHTDTQPIHTTLFPSNWELSAMRAAAIARLLSERGIPKERISAIGYADQYPVADNATVEGREENRRVVIIVANHKNVLRLRNPAEITYHTNKNPLIYK